MLAGKRITSKSFVKVGITQETSWRVRRMRCCLANLLLWCYGSRRLICGHNRADQVGNIGFVTGLCDIKCDKPISHTMDLIKGCWGFWGLLRVVEEFLRFVEGCQEPLRFVESCQELLRIGEGCWGLLRVVEDCWELLRVVEGCWGLIRVVKGYQGLLRVVEGCCEVCWGLLRVFEGYQELLRVFGEFLRFVECWGLLRVVEGLLRAVEDNNHLFIVEICMERWGTGPCKIQCLWGWGGRYLGVEGNTWCRDWDIFLGQQPSFYCTSLTCCFIFFLYYIYARLFACHNQLRQVMTADLWLATEHDQSCQSWSQSWLLGLCDLT